MPAPLPPLPFAGLAYFLERANMQNLPEGGLGDTWEVSRKGTILVSNWT